MAKVLKTRLVENGGIQLCDTNEFITGSWQSDIVLDNYRTMFLTTDKIGTKSETPPLVICLHNIYYRTQLKYLVG